MFKYRAFLTLNPPHRHAARNDSPVEGRTRRAFELLARMRYCYTDRMSGWSEPKFAWEPLTPRGVAAYARASLRRLFMVQTVVAALAALAVGFFLLEDVFPTVSAAVNALPDQGRLHHGRLEWSGNSPDLLAEGPLLAFIVDMDHTGQIRSPADLQFEFGTNSLAIISLLGKAEVPYPDDFGPQMYVPVNRPDLQPQWDAWRPDVLLSAVVGTFVGLMLTWFGLATVYCLPVWVIASVTGRQLGFGGAWRLAGAALMPGALLVTLALGAYVLGICDLLQFLYAFGLHWVLGWIYLGVAPLFLAVTGHQAPKNPFKPKA